MAKRLVRIYLHADRDANYELAKKIGIAPASEAERMFSHAFSEVEIIASVDISTGDVSIVNISMERDPQVVN